MITFRPDYSLINNCSPVALNLEDNEQGERRCTELAIITDTEEKYLSELMARYDVPANMLPEIAWFYHIGQQIARPTSDKVVDHIATHYGWKSLTYKRPQPINEEEFREYEQAANQEGWKVLKEAHEEVKITIRELKYLKKLKTLSHARFYTYKGKGFGIDSKGLLTVIERIFSNEIGKVQLSEIVSSETIRLSDTYKLYTKGKAKNEIAHTKLYRDRQNYATMLYRFLTLNTKMTDYKKYVFGAGLMNKASFEFACSKEYPIYEDSPIEYSNNFKSWVKPKPNRLNISKE